MAYVTPPTFVSGTTATAADINILGADIVYLKGQTDSIQTSAVKVNRTSAQSIPDNTWTPVVWNNQIGDIGNWWTSGTNLVVPSDFPAGVTDYLAILPLIAKFDVNATGNRGARTLLNGSVVDQITLSAAAGDPTVISFTSTMSTIAQTDIITMEVFQTSGGALDLTGVVITAIRLFPSA